MPAYIKKIRVDFTGHTAQGLAYTAVLDDFWGQIKASMEARGFSRDPQAPCRWSYDSKDREIEFTLKDTNPMKLKNALSDIKIVAERLGATAESMAPAFESNLLRRV